MRVLIPLPERDFDPTESAIPWRALKEAGHTIAFATPAGAPAHADPRVLTGAGFGPLRPLLRAVEHARAVYAEMADATEFRSPIPYDDLEGESFDAVHLPGGHAPGMKSLLESEAVQRAVAGCMLADKPVGAICHGVLVVARARNPETGRSILYGRKTTALLRSQELAAWAGTALWLGSYYRTYPETVEDEVTRALENANDFVRGSWLLGREGPDRPEHGFTVRDRHYLSARFPGDAYRFATDYVELLADFARSTSHSTARRTASS